MHSFAKLILIFASCLMVLGAPLAAQEGGPYTCPPCTDGGVRPNPEPVTMSLLGLGGLGLVYSLRRRKGEKGTLLR